MDTPQKPPAPTQEPAAGQAILPDAALLAAALRLNNAHAVETGPLDGPALADMLAMAFYRAIPVAGNAGDDAGTAAGEPGEPCADGLLIAFDERADYDSANFQWFRARYPRFIYVDRVIVAGHARGRGLARTLYDGLFAAARAAGHDVITCEINLDPPNPGSIAFHDAMGFTAVGQAILPNGKTVSYRQRSLMG
ncbi:MAG: GNAT family N-acetyltransferase [Sphingopyxis sp.]